MDTTVALIFSLGMVLGGQDTSVTGIEKTAFHQVTTATLNQRQHKVRQRIKLTNAWLNRHKQDRRTSVLAKKRSTTLHLASKLSCTADWSAT